MSQGKLGDTVGLTFQQIQKYERGANRIGASRLYDLSRVLDVSIAYFFEEMPNEISEQRYKSVNKHLSNDVSAFETDDITRRETLELVRNYYKVSNPVVRKRLLNSQKYLRHRIFQQTKTLDLITISDTNPFIISAEKPAGTWGIWIACAPMVKMSLSGLTDNRALDPLV